MIKVSETSVYTVGHNSVFAPPALGSTFRFGVVDVHGVAEDEDEKTFFGPPLQLTDQVIFNLVGIIFNCTSSLNSLRSGSISS